MDINNQLLQVQQKIEQLIENDPVLTSLPKDISLEELRDIVGFKEGRVWKIIIERYDNQLVEIYVDKEATVKGVKKSFQFYFSLQQKRMKTKINWKSFWRRYDLSLDGRRLQDNSSIKDTGIANHCKLQFITKIKCK